MYRSNAGTPPFAAESARFQLGLGDLNVTLWHSATDDCSSVPSRAHAIGEVAPAAIDRKVPARWKLVPNASPMRIGTCSVPRAAGDSKDAEITVTQAGGSMKDNAKR